MTVFLASGVVLAGCGTSREQLLATSQSQLQLRSIQTRVFDTTDRDKTLRTVVATMQDLGFVIDNANHTLGSVSGTKLDNFLLRMTVTVRPKGTTQLLVRANMQFNIHEVDEPEPYQMFFTALGRAMFLDAHMEEASPEQTPVATPKATSVSPTESGAKESRGATGEKTFGIVEPKPLAIPEGAALPGAIAAVPAFKTLVGTWSGKIEYGLHARTRDGDWPVTVTIREDGSYGATTLRQSTGKVQTAGGKYEIKIEVASGVEAFRVALYDREGKRILKGVSHDGSKTIEMTQQNTPKISERSESKVPVVTSAVTAPGATPFAIIAGTWSGTIDGPESRAGWPDYTVTMTIREDGSYKGNTSYQNFAGTMQLAGDRLRFKAVTGFATRQQTVNVTLREQDGKRVLKGVSEDGLTRWELTPVKDW